MQSLIYIADILKLRQYKTTWPHHFAPPETSESSQKTPSVRTNKFNFMMMTDPPI
jgi:hypothetical protein